MEAKKYLKWYNKIGYGSGDIAGNVVYAFLTSFVMVYLTDTIGLASGIVGTLIAVSKLLDGFTDIFFGSMIDKTHSKMGKARPWMLYAQIGVSLCLVLLFSIPGGMSETAQYAYFFAFYTALNAIFYTANGIAYSALSALITRNKNERVQLGSIRFMFAVATNIKIGAQNMHFEETGAYTGEVSGKMLKSINVEYVIIGHSERRQYFNETDESVNKKVKASFKYGLKPIVCVGETLEQRENGKTIEIITNQTKLALEGLEKEQVENTIIAYEPIWAIGTGKTATKEDANESIKSIRNKISEIYGQETANRVIIQYGGSVKSGNSKELFEMSDIDGGLVGGASLKAEEFSKIVNFDK